MNPIQIIEINGINTKNMTHGEAIDLIKSGQGMVRLLVRRGKMPPSALMGAYMRTASAYRVIMVVRD